MNVIFKEHLQIPYCLTETPTELKKAKLKFSYSPQPVDDEIFVWQHPLLTASDITKQDLDWNIFEEEPVFFNSPQKESLLPFDIFSFSFYLLTRYEEYLPHSKDKHGRFPATGSIAFQHDFLHKPLVDILVLKFIEKLKQHLPELNYKLKKTEYLATYDIDNAYAYKHKGLCRSVGGLLKNVIRFDFKEVTNRLNVLIRSKSDPFDSYDYIRSLQEQYQHETIYFILFSKTGDFDRGLNPGNKHFHLLIKKLDKETTVGIHPSYASATDKIQLQKEISGLSDVVQRKITSARSHFLLLNFPETYQRFIENGIEVDYTLGYADWAGFRASTCKPFHFFDLTENKETSLKLFPLAYMDGTLQGYMKLSEKEGLNMIKQLIDAVYSVSGTFISLWHNETLGKKSWKEWQKAYKQSLDYFSGKQNHQ